MKTISRNSAPADLGWRWHL